MKSCFDSTVKEKSWIVYMSPRMDYCTIESDGNKTDGAQDW